MLYPVAIYQANGQFVAHTPDLPALSIMGENMADVIRNARSIIIDHLQELADKNEPIPKGSDLGHHLDNPDFFGQTWAIISLDSLRFSQATIAYQLNIPKKLLDEIYATLGSGANVDAVQDFIISSVQQKLTKTLT